MRPPPRFSAGRAWPLAAVALLAAAARAEEGARDRDAAAPAPARADGQARAAPPAAAPDGRRPLEPLPPAPVLLEKALRGFLEAGPGRETLDDVMRRAGARNRAAAEAAEAAQRQQFIRQQAQQFDQMLQPLLRVELALVRRACGSLAPEARAEVLAASRQAVRDVAERVARLQLDGTVGAEPLDIRREIHGKVAAALEPRADREEFAAFERESRLRQERRAEAARIRIVAKLDERLGLTAAQRRAVLEDLRNRWQPGWIRELEDHDGGMINDQPPAPDFAAASIEPHLDDAQRRRWREWSEAAGWKQVPRVSIDWSELNAIQQTPLKLDAWWRP